MNQVDEFETLKAVQVTDFELVIYLLTENGMSSYAIAKKFGKSPSGVRYTYETAKKKIDRQADAGLFTTKIQPVDK